MDTDQIILGFLMSGPKSGYKIKNITGRLMMAYNLSLNQIYPALRKLEATDLVRKEVVIQTGKPNKHVYSITKRAGRNFSSLSFLPHPVDYQLDFSYQGLFLPVSHQGADHRAVRERDQLAGRAARGSGAHERRCPAAGDENGQFIYRVIVGMLDMLKTVYQNELEKRKSS